MRSWAVPMLGGAFIALSGLTDGMALWELACFYAGLGCFIFGWTDSEA